MKNKIILITGSTDGIGKVTAIALAKQGYTIIIHGRNKTKAEATKDEIAAATGNKKIDILIADLLSLSDIKRAAEEFKKKYDHLDILINNAGAIFNKTREVTSEGHEKTLMLNLFAPFLLTELLLGHLEKSKAARIINISSAMHRRGSKPDFSDFQFEKKYSPAGAYGQSKLYLIWITRHLAKLLKDKGINNITVNASHPGAVATSFGQNAKKGFIIDEVFKIALHFMDKIEDGARTSIYLATSPEVDNVSGQFFSNKEKLEKPSDKFYTTENEQKVWDYCYATVKQYI